MSFGSILANNAEIQIEKWTPTDLSFKTSITWKFSPTSPFEVDFYAQVKGPGNIYMKVPGFYDGNDTWKIRFTPNKIGKWVITTKSDVLELDNKQIIVDCIATSNPNSQGALIVNPKSPHHFATEDGKPFFPVGYEVNWLFAMDMEAEEKALPTLNPFLDKLVNSGFNWVNVNVWAYDTGWKKGKTEEFDFGPSLLSPWEGTVEQSNFKIFNLKYWQHFDKVIQALNSRGIITCLYFKVYNKHSSYPTNNSFEDDMYFRWIIARYAAYPNVVWSLAKEAQYEKSTSYKVNRLKFIRETDSYNRLITVHDDKLTYDLGHYNDLTDFRSSQEHKEVQATILKQIAANDWPIFMAESGYEHGPKGLKDKTYAKSNTPEDVIKYMWNIQMTGVYNAYYYTYTAWDVIRYNDNPPGYGYVKHFANFFKTIDYWLLQSNDKLVDGARCLENPGKEYIIYQEESKKFQLNLPQLPKSYSAKWYQPLTGESIEVTQLQKGLNDLTPPAQWENTPIVLHIKKEEK